MSEGVVGSAIELGGCLAVDALFDLLAAAEEDGALLEGRHRHYDDEDLRRAIAGARPLRFSRTGAAEEFAELELFCRQQRLVYRRFADGGPTGHPTVLYWHPDRADATPAAATAGGQLYLTLVDLAAAHEAGNTLAEVIAALCARSADVPPLELV